mmetsp:Transcript_44007/g.141920  ORF Transcript_44007/g.141920 Transcript_44007/m.141920 type:complete len:222 (-) Transcript_44007:1493-2158(-)
MRDMPGSESSSPSHTSADASYPTSASLHRITAGTSQRAHAPSSEAVPADAEPSEASTATSTTRCAPWHAPCSARSSAGEAERTSAKPRCRSSRRTWRTSADSAPGLAELRTATRPACSALGSTDTSGAVLRSLAARHRSHVTSRERRARTRHAAAAARNWPLVAPRSACSDAGGGGGGGGGAVRPAGAKKGKQPVRLGSQPRLRGGSVGRRSSQRLRELFP